MDSQFILMLGSNGFNFKEIGVASMVLFAVIDIVGNIPLIIALKERTGRIYPLRTASVSLFILIGFLFVGESILGLIGVGINEFAVAGSFVLFFMALEMILGVEIFKDNGEGSKKVASVVPLAFPMIAGAGTMTSLISLRAEFELVNILIAILLNILVVWIVLKLTATIERIIGSTGIAILKKVFGIILLAIAIKLFSSNIRELF
ncbi:MAG: MarC family protein [Crocinitomicaceae bacterium]|nr:MarC family protein [Crocinitomicaceae bacterium]MDG1735416.1 MarC family protein [Crocinitomicaceae bacterium]MDG2506058.1 MarC family protein [Crocinitomicaceae bacterium]